MPGPVVGHAELDPVAAGRARDRDPVSRAGVVDGVPREIAKHLRETLGVGLQLAVGHAGSTRKSRSRRAVAGPARDPPGSPPARSCAGGPARRPPPARARACRRPAGSSGRARAAAVSTTAPPLARVVPDALQQLGLARGAPSAVCAARARRRTRTPAGAGRRPRAGRACDRTTRRAAASRRCFARLRCGG